VRLLRLGLGGLGLVLFGDWIDRGNDKGNKGGGE